MTMGKSVAIALLITADGDDLLFGAQTLLTLSLSLTMQAVVNTATAYVRLRLRDWQYPQINHWLRSVKGWWVRSSLNAPTARRRYDTDANQLNLRSHALFTVSLVQLSARVYSQ